MKFLVDINNSMYYSCTGGRGVSMGANMSIRGGVIKRPSSMPVRGGPPLKRVATDR